MFLQKSPSKFTGGISMLWKGMNLTYLNNFFLEYFKLKSKNNANLFLYESARSAILHVLKILDVKYEDQIIISSFTCDAVTKSVINSGAKVVYVDINKDLTMNDKCVLNAININTKALILQNTFGRLGLKMSTIKKIKKKNIIIIEDNCLSAGSKFLNITLGQLGDVNIYSLEASKTLTIGWGGVLIINNIKYKKKIKKSYKFLKSVNLFNDFLRLSQLLISLYFIKYPKFYGNIFWYFFYGTRIFRKSSKSSELNPTKIGFFTRKFFLYLYPKFNKLYKETNRNYISLINHIKKEKLSCPVMQKKKEFIITPRIPLYVKNKNNILHLAKEMKIELGDWFIESPPIYKLNECIIHSCKTSREISKKIINVPSYFSLKKEEILRLKKLLSNISQIEK